MTWCAYLLVGLGLVVCCNGFWVGLPMKRAVSSRVLLAGKPDLFSDDLFDDDEKPAATGDPKKDAKEPPKKSYLDQKWKLNSEDAAGFKGFPKKAGETADAGAKAPASTSTDGKRPATSKPAEKVPVFALTYKFRKEYVDVSVESVLADHKGHAAKFKRLLNSDVIKMKKARGAVVLWAGFSETDKEETRADIMRFIEDDPFITKDIVEHWDIIDMTPGGENDPNAAAALPSASVASAGK